MDITSKQIAAKVKAVCPICAITRALYRIPRDPARRRFSKVGELLAIDTWGPYPIEGLDGVRYALFVTDDATRYTWVEFFNTKDKIHKLMQNKCKSIANNFDTTIKKIRADNEFDVASTREWAKRNGIVTEFTVPYTHHQVGTAERVNRTIRERSAAMIQEQQPSDQIKKILTNRTEELLRNTTIPEVVWPEAVRHAV